MDQIDFLNNQIETLKQQNKELKAENSELHNVINNVIQWYYGEVGYIDTEKLDGLRDILNI